VAPFGGCCLAPMRSMNPCASSTDPGSPGSCPRRPIAVGFSRMRICHSSRRFGSRVRSTAMPEGLPRAEARLDLRPPERSALRALVRPHARGRRLILAAAQSRPRNPSYGAAAARAAGRGNREDRVLFAVPQMGVAVPGLPRSKLPGQEHLPCVPFDTQMPLNRRRYSVSYSKNAHDLDPPYGIEP
jgi:hypothetical protein